MEKIDGKILEQLWRPKKESHKGQNGKLLIIGGSELFHAASRWALRVASRIVDLVFYSSVPQNNRLIEEAKGEFWDGIVVPRGEVESYIKEADCVLIGPGMVRSEGRSRKWEKVEEMLESDDTAAIVEYLFSKYPKKRWVVDAGALQMMRVERINPQMILTPHVREFERLFGKKIEVLIEERQVREENRTVRAVREVVAKYGGTVVLKGPVDLVCSRQRCGYNTTGNEGMTKGGTGDVLAGLIAAFYCKSEAFAASAAGVYVNGLAGDRLYRRVGPYFNASDLVEEIPVVLGELLGKRG